MTRIIDLDEVSVPDIACGHFLGDTCCVLRRKHDGEHRPASVVIVDRNLQPVNGKVVASVGTGEKFDARVLDYKGRHSIHLSEHGAKDGGPYWQTDHQVNRPAVRVGDRWVRRCPTLEVVTA